MFQSRAEKVRSSCSSQRQHLLVALDAWDPTVLPFSRFNPVSRMKMRTNCSTRQHRSFDGLNVGDLMTPPFSWWVPVSCHKDADELLCSALSPPYRSECRRPETASISVLDSSLSHTNENELIYSASSCRGLSGCGRASSSG